MNISRHGSSLPCRFHTQSHVRPAMTRYCNPLLFRRSASSSFSGSTSARWLLHGCEHAVCKFSSSVPPARVLFGSQSMPGAFYKRRESCLREVAQLFHDLFCLSPSSSPVRHLLRSVSGHRNRLRPAVRFASELVADRRTQIQPRESPMRLIIDLESLAA